MKKAFTLIEMLVVVAIISILIAASLGGYTTMTARAEKVRTQELVSNVATALAALFQNEGAWPTRLAAKGKDGFGKLDEEQAYSLVDGEEYVTLKKSNGKLVGYDRFGLVTPTAMAVIKRMGERAKKTTKVGGSAGTIDDHILRYALDLDGDGLIENVSIGGQKVSVRATAIVWCCGPDGVIGPYPYAAGAKMTKAAKDDVYSWTPGQTRRVK